MGRRFTQIHAEKAKLKIPDNKWIAPCLLSAFVLFSYPENLRLSASNYTIFYGALNHVGFRAAMHPTWCMAEGVGFEPTSPFGETVFKTAAIDHSAIPPGKQLIAQSFFCSIRYELSAMSYELFLCTMRFSILLTPPM
jgi:hypothetical protein